MDNEQNLIDFLSEMEAGSLGLDEAIRDYGHLLEDSSIDQAYYDYMDSRAAIKKTLKRVVKNNDLHYLENLLD